MVSRKRHARCQRRKRRVPAPCCPNAVRMQDRG
jgi:hypothetical protein